MNKENAKLEDVVDILFDEFCGGDMSNGDKKPNQNKFVSWDRAKKEFAFIFGHIRENIVTSDYDTDEGFECRLKIAEAKHEHCIAIKGAHKGGHIHWSNKDRKITKSNSNNTTLLTIPDVDYKCGIKVIATTGEIKRAKNVACLSCDMPDDNTKRAPFREIVYCNLKEDGTLDEIPFYDLPLKGYKDTFLNMAAGDGRNDKMYAFMIPFVNAGYDYTQFREVAEIVNEFIMAEPFAAEEFELVTRKSDWDKLENSDTKFYSGRSFRHDIFAEYIRKQHNIKQINKRLHIYKDGVYIPDHQAIESAMIKIIPQLKSTQRTEVLKQLSLICDNISLDDSLAQYIAFRNGIYDVMSDELIPFSPEIIITNKIPWDYNSNAYSQLADETLNKIACHDSQVRALLEECIGSCFYRSNKLGRGKAFILTGDKKNGKSTFLDVIQYILKDDNISSVDLKDLSSKFQNAELFGKLANIGDDIGDMYVPDASVFKKLVTGNRIQVQRKGERPFEFNNYAKLLFSANDIPRIKDTTGAVQSRLLIIPFNAVFSPDDPDYDENIVWKLKHQDSIEYFIKVGIEGLKRVRKEQQYTKADVVEAELKEYEISNNPILAFFEDMTADDIENEPTTYVYRQYEVFCSENGFQSVSKNKLTKEIRRHFGLIVDKNPRKIKGKSVRCYVAV